MPAIYLPCSVLRARAASVLYLILLVAFLSGCQGSGENDNKAVSTEGTVYGEVLGSGTFSLVGLGSWDWYRLRLPHSDGNAYAIWFAPSGSNAEPAVLFAQPYAGVTWTGEDVDQRWTAEYLAYIGGGGSGSLCAPDVDGPAWDMTSPGEVCFEPTLEEDLGAQSVVFLLNNVGVLHVFGRFYAGGNVWNDVQDMVAGLQYLKQNQRVDPARVGLFGGSWGGFEALYGTAYAPADITPVATAALFPVIDFEQLQDFVINDLPGLTSMTTYPDYAAFYDPYLRRLYDSTGNPPLANYSGFIATDIGSAIDSPVLVPHDDSDTILPAAASHDFAMAYPANVEGFWYSRSNTIDYNGAPLTHGLIIEETPFPAIFTFSFDYLLERMMPAGEEIVLTYAASNIHNFFSNIRIYQMAGFDVDWLLPRLIELADDRVTLYNLESAVLAPISGPQLVVQEIDAVWGTGETAATIQNWLINNGLPLP